MLEKLMNGIIEKIRELKIFTQLEPYEGQFDDIDNYLIVPPSCFIEFSGGRPENQLKEKHIVNFDLYIITNHVKGKLNIPMLNIIDQIKDYLNKKRIASSGEVEYTAFDRMAIFPGLCSYRMSFVFKQDL